MPDLSFALRGPIELSSRLGSGSLTIRTEAELTHALVSLTARDPDSDVVARSTVELRGGTLVVHGPRNQETARRGYDGSRDAMDVEIAVPTGTGMKITAVSADVRVHGTTGAVDVTSGSADVAIDDVDGPLRMRGGSGDIEVGRVTGVASIKGGSGQIRIGECGRELQVGAGSGDIELGVAGGPVRLRSGSGTVAVSVADGDVDLISGSGDLMVGLRPGRPARLDVLTGSGHFHSDMPVETTAPRSGTPITVHARTGSGDVTIRRAPAAETMAGATAGHQG